MKLSAGERIEGYYQASNKAVSAFTIQDPTGKTVRDYGATQVTNFLVIADMPGTYLLIWQVRNNLSYGEASSLSFAVTYSLDVYGF